VALARSEKPAVAQSIQSPLFYLQQGCVLVNGTARGRRQAPLIFRMLLSSKPTGRSDEPGSSAADPVQPFQT
jgi:hypothetical protein